VRGRAVQRFRECLERIQGWVENTSPFWLGAKVSFHDAYAFTLLRWGGIAGIDPQSLPRSSANASGSTPTRLAEGARLADVGVRREHGPGVLLRLVVLAPR